MREHARPAGPAQRVADERGPGLLLFDGDGELTSINDDALAWLDELIVEPAIASEVAPIIAQAYELSTREQQITELIARGVSTAEMAERLFLSIHTVRDYVKAIFDKVGVSSRGELVATLFAEHVVPSHLTPDAHLRS